MEMEVLTLRYVNRFLILKYNDIIVFEYLQTYKDSLNIIFFLILQEFMMATDMTASGSPEEKLRYDSLKVHSE